MEGLRPKQEFAPPLQLGRIIHRYLEHFYSPLKHKRPPSPAIRHHNALQLIEREFTETFRQLAVAAQVAGEEETGKQMLDLAPKAERICQRYFEVRGSQETHRVLLCEQYLTLPVTGDDVAPVVVDLLTQDDQGNVWLWEHKTTGNVPPSTRRLRDLQTLLGAVIVEENLKIKITGIIWNYLRTKEPIVPELLKAGALTKRQDLDTTWPVYSAQIKAHRLDAEDYREVEERLMGKEEEVFFPRIELPLVQSEQVILRDFIFTLHDIRTATSNPEFIPVRNISQPCDYCIYAKVCEAALLGGDEEELKMRLFKKGPPDGYAAAAAPSRSSWD